MNGCSVSAMFHLLDASASFARARLHMPLSWPRPSFTRYICGQRSSATMPAGMLVTEAVAGRGRGGALPCGARSDAVLVMCVSFMPLAELPLCRGFTFSGQRLFGRWRRGGALSRGTPFAHTVATCASSGSIRKLGRADLLVKGRALGDALLARDKNSGTLPIRPLSVNEIRRRNVAGLNPPFEGRNRNPLERRAIAGVQ